CGEVVSTAKQINDDEVIAPLKKVMRKATEEDLIQLEENRKRSEEAFSICLEKIQKHDLEMKLIDVEYTFDNNKIMFYFTADGRVDFRELVKDLASVFRTRIELRQIGVRDEAKMLGGIGACGRSLCCNSHLSEFHPVSIKMAKEQSLSLNPTKISGSCGRLMCCLKYEQDTYEYLLKKTPKIDAVVQTPNGQGVVVQVSLLKEMVRVKLDNEQNTDIVDYSVKDVRVVKDAEKKADPEDKVLEELKVLED
ncbi:MAG: stage 0 sporulation family protein, partial [Clostridiaceae bacterium]|nr:stage 0 sporulation family protein [Clostridiaceae bacterium]